MAERFKPTPQQDDFIRKAPAESVLIACPGSGKTRTAVLRFIERCKSQPPCGVAYLSFTNVAVEEAQKRAREANAGGLVGYPNIISTIDSFFKQYVFEPFIRCKYEDVPTKVYLFADRAPAGIASDSPYKIWDVRPNKAVKGGASIKDPLFAWDARAYLKDDTDLTYEYDKGSFKTDWADVSKAKEPAILAAKIAYLKKGYATHNDILLFSGILFESADLNVAEILAKRFGEIIVDEAQDTSALQQGLLSYLVAAGSKICYIGDPKQGIYQFNRANPKYLKDLVRKTHREYPLTKNFRSIEAIVDVVNARFTTSMAHDREKKHSLHGAYVFVGNEADAISAFEAFLARTEIAIENAAIIVRKRQHLSTVLEDYDAKGLRIGPRLAIEAWQCELRGEPQDALLTMTRLLRTVVKEDASPSIDDRLEELAWGLLVGSHFPEPQGNETPKAWAARLKSGIRNFLTEHGIEERSDLGTLFASNGLEDKGTALDEFCFAPPRLRTTVIHQVKGESISAVLVVAPKDQHKSWLDPASSEEENICYVAFTRAANVLVLQCPTDNIAEQWRRLGFKDLPPP